MQYRDVACWILVFEYIIAATSLGGGIESILRLSTAIASSAQADLRRHTSAYIVFLDDIYRCFLDKMLDLSYLVMTAADCAAWNERHPHNIVSLNQLLEVRASEQPDEICVGFSTKADDLFGCDTLSAFRSSLQTLA